MQSYSMVFTLSRQINKQKVRENNNLLREGNTVFVKYQAQRGSPLRTPLCKLRQDNVLWNDPDDFHNAVGKQRSYKMNK